MVKPIKWPDLKLPPINLWSRPTGNTVVFQQVNPDRRVRKVNTKRNRFTNR